MTGWPLMTASVRWLPRVEATTRDFPLVDRAGGSCSGSRMTNSPFSMLTFIPRSFSRCGRAGAGRCRGRAARVPRPRLVASDAVLRAEDDGDNGGLFAGPVGLVRVVPLGGVL